MSYCCLTLMSITIPNECKCDMTSHETFETSSNYEFGSPTFGPLVTLKIY